MAAITRVPGGRLAALRAAQRGTPAGHGAISLALSAPRRLSDEHAEISLENYRQPNLRPFQRHPACPGLQFTLRSAAHQHGPAWRQRHRAEGDERYLYQHPSRNLSAIASSAGRTALTGPRSPVQIPPRRLGRGSQRQRTIPCRSGKMMDVSLNDGAVVDQIGGSCRCQLLAPSMQPAEFLRACCRPL
jgi:hypothetical protein